jgi:hypothetical protein
VGVEDLPLGKVQFFQRRRAEYRSALSGHAERFSAAALSGQKQRRSWTICRISIAQDAGAPNRLAALFKARIAAMTVMAAGADGTPRIFPVAMGMMPEDRRVLSCTLIDVEILPVIAVAAFHVAHDRIARICGRRAGGREEDEQNKQRRP